MINKAIKNVNKLLYIYSSKDTNIHCCFNKYQNKTIYIRNKNHENLTLQLRLAYNFITFNSYSFTNPDSSYDLFVYDQDILINKQIQLYDYHTKFFRLVNKCINKIVI